jgi:hypothetical protein
MVTIYRQLVLDIKWLIFNFYKQKHKHDQKKLQMIQRISNSNLHDKVLIIGNRLANERQNSMCDQNSDIVKSNSNGIQADLRASKKSPIQTQSLVGTAMPVPTGSSNQGIRDDAQMADFISSFLFPLSFIIFNIIYWMVYLNMQVESSN